MINNNFILVLTAAGSSRRFGKNEKKEFFVMKNNKTVLYNSLKPFTLFPNLKAIVITHKDGLKEETENCLDPEGLSVPYYLVKGGKSRTESIKNALSFIKKNNISETSSLVLIHDGARPFINISLINDVIENTIKYGAAVPAIPAPPDTLSRMDDDGCIKENIDRDRLYCIQTPQGFLKDNIIDAYDKIKSDEVYTDDEEVYRKNGERVRIVPGSIYNKKITYRRDREDLWE